MSEKLPVAAEGARPTDPAVPVEPTVAVEPAAPAGDPFPRERFVALVGRLPRYLRLAWGLAGEPRLSRSRKAGVLAAAAYLASPVDAIPGIIPVVGQVDDIAVALFALRAALRSLDPATRGAVLAAAGLEPDDLDHDLGTLGLTAAWLARRGVVIGKRLALLAAATSLAIGRAGGRALRRGAPVAARASRRAAVATADVVRTRAPGAATAGARAARAAGGALGRPGRSAAGWVRGRGRTTSPDGLPVEREADEPPGPEPA
jgi:uncharacterized membrane protein YkvA (DUF1232 family)